MKKRIPVLFILLVILSVFSFYSCKAKKESPEIQKWKQKILNKRAEKDKEFATSPISPFAGLKRMTVEKNTTAYLIFDEGSFSLSKEKSDRALFSVFQKDGGNWQWEVFNSELVCKTEQKIIKSGDVLKGSVLCNFGKYTIEEYPLDERLVIVVFSPDRKEFKQFKHLFYYPPNPEYRVEAKLIKFENPKQVKMITSQNLIKTFYRYAKVVFKIKEQEIRLMAYKKYLSKGPGHAWLFIPFKDKTNEVETYPAGRFIEIKEPSSDIFIFDFNEAFNPLCNYAHVYNCSYPPYENFLDIEIKAGEKTYHNSN